MERWAAEDVDRAMRHHVLPTYDLEQRSLQEMHSGYEVELFTEVLQLNKRAALCCVQSLHSMR